jgi:hypothetical protein
MSCFYDVSGDLCGGSKRIVLRRCPQGETVCADGHCRLDCSTEYDNPCPCAALPVVCPKIDDHYDACQATYASFYTAETECLKTEEEAMASMTFHEWPFIVGGLWMVVVSLAIVIYCAINAKHHHHHSSGGGDLKHLEGGQGHCGFQEDWVGTILYMLVVGTMWGIQAVLLVLVILYYMKEGAITTTQAVEWEDERQILLTFEIVWAVGLVWTFAMKWPDKLRSMFWKKCPLRQATHVAVWTPNTTPAHGVVVSSDTYTEQIRRFLNTTKSVFNRILAALFSEDLSLGEGQWTYCDVYEELDNSKHFVHNFRRYNLDFTKDEFVPGSWNWKGQDSIQKLHEAQTRIGTTTSGRSETGRWTQYDSNAQTNTLERPSKGIYATLLYVSELHHMDLGSLVSIQSLTLTLGGLYLLLHILTSPFFYAILFSVLFC